MSLHPPRLEAPDPSRRAAGRLKVAHRLPAGRCGRTAAENAAVIAIGHAPTISIDQLSRILRLSHAGTVPLVDRLVERNLVEKRPSALDRRIISLALTMDGWRQRDKLLALRRAVSTVLLNQVAPENLAALEHVAETIAAALPEDTHSALTTCRFCDERNLILSTEAQLNG